MPWLTLYAEHCASTGITAVHLARCVVVRHTHLDAGGAVAARFQVGHARQPGCGIQGQVGPLVTAGQ